jgi:hypothetical protein
MAITLDTPEQIAAYRLLAIRRALEFEVQTGMNMTRGNAALHGAQQVARERGLKVPRTKKAALALMNEIVAEELGL